MSDNSDLIDFGSLLTADELALRDTVRAFVDSEIKPNIADWYQKAVFPAMGAARDAFEAALDYSKGRMLQKTL